MRGVTSKSLLSNLFSCFKGSADANPASHTSVGSIAEKSASKISSKNRLFAKPGLHPIYKLVNVKDLGLLVQQVGIAMPKNERSSTANSVSFSKISGLSQVSSYAARASNNMQHVDPLNNHRQPPQQLKNHYRLAEMEKTIVREEQTLLTLRIKSLSLSTELGTDCSADLAEILDNNRPGQRLPKLEQLLSKIPGHHSDNTTPNTLVKTSFLNVVTEMTRKKSDEITTLRINLLKLQGTTGPKYERRLKILFESSNSAERDNHFTQLSQEISACVIKQNETAKRLK